MDFEYTALDKTGKRKCGVVDALTVSDARFSLRSDEMYPIELRMKSSEGFRMNLWNRVKKRDIATFSRQLTTLLEAGIPLAQALSALAEETEENRALREVITDIMVKVGEGKSLSLALSSYPWLFSPVFVNLVRAGESSVTLEKVLRELSEFTEKEIAFRNKLRAVLAYPVLVSVIGVGIVSFLLAVVLPALTRIFIEMSQVLPLPTRILISAGDLFHKFWWLMCIGIAAIFFGVSEIGKTTSGRKVYDRMKLRLPVVGKLVLKSAISRFCRTLGTLIRSGVPILSSLDISKNVVGNKILAGSIERAKQDVKEGESITNPLRKEGIFPPFVLRLISSGEESGHLEEMLFKIADTYDEEVSSSVTTLSSLLEPLMIVLMGAVIGFVVLAVLLPIFEMNQIIR